MSVNWSQVNERRISEKTQEIQLYCAQKRRDMTPKAFTLARESFEELLKNISDRNPYSTELCESILRKMANQKEQVARCTKWQAASLARTIVYKCVGDDLNLYPVSAEMKLNRSKVRRFKECDIPSDELTVKDYLYVAAAITEGENFSSSTMRQVYEWFIEIGLDPFQTRVYSILYQKKTPLSIRSIPQYNLFSSEYRKAAKVLVNKGYIYELPNDVYCVTETVIA